MVVQIDLVYAHTMSNDILLNGISAEMWLRYMLLLKMFYIFSALILYLELMVFKYNFSTTYKENV